MGQMPRIARVGRSTKESEVKVELNLDGSGKIDVETGVPFFDHMLSQLGKHAGFDLTVKPKAMLMLIHTILLKTPLFAVGQALREALGDKSGIRRFWRLRWFP